MPRVGIRNKRIKIGNDPVSSSEGTSYRKLMCVLFDLALLKVYENTSFFRFVYHDGIFEAPDGPKKLALLDVIREQVSGKKLQYILTLIESDLPRDENGKAVNFIGGEVVV